MRPKLAFLAALLAIGAASAMADDADPPSRVARLNYQSGSVSFRPGSVEEWTAATINYPLTTGDHLWTDTGSQTEMHVGSTAIRMSPMTAMLFLNLDDRIVQLSVTSGSVNIRLRQLEDGDTFEVDTPNVAITLLRPGDYRIDADGDNARTTVTVRGGDAEVTGGGSAFVVHARQTAMLTGMDSISQEVQPLAGFNEFDRWCDARDRHEDEESISARYVPRDMVGYEDLDENGTWSEVPEYGPVWRPRVVDVGWAPYRYGHWAWVDPWGWTWIDDAPWGFAPFHYGRWAMVAGGWAWVPGRMIVGVRPVYAPALVAFVGGPRFGVSLSVGGGGMAAWFPLGPGEVYRPAYHTSEVYVRQVNITHVNNITAVNNVRYRNQGVAGAVTVVSHDTFVNARPVRRGVVVVDNREIVNAQVVGAAPGISPQRASIMGRVGPGVAPPPARFAARPVVARTAPPPPPVSFAVRQRAIEANQGRPLDAGQVNGMRGNMGDRNPNVRVVAPVIRRAPDQPAIRNAQPPVPDRRIETRPAPEDRPMRNDRPARVDQPVQRNVEPPRPAEPPRNLDQPRTERPARVEPPAQPAPPRNVDQPAPPRRFETRPPEQPRQEAQPQRSAPPARVEQPRQEPQRPAPPARVEQPRQDAPPPTAERGARRDERKVEKKGEKKGEEKKDK